MLYNNHNIHNIDLSKYKRFVAIGCSFTRYRWASWADLLASEMPGAEYINVGRSGAGNTYIMTALHQLKNKLQLNSDDLVGIMWSTYCREDRLLDGNWSTPGNIYTQGDYDEQFVQKFADFDWYMLRDTALISTTMQSLQTAEFDCFAMEGVNLNEQGYYAGLPDEEVDIKVSAEHDTLKPSLLTYNNGEWPVHYSYINSPHKPWGGDGSIFEDYHPSAPVYRQYLQHLGFPMTEYSETLSDLSDNMMKQVQGDDVFTDEQWPWQDHYAGDLV
jgi:hypothetical protein